MRARIKAWEDLPERVRCCEAARKAYGEHVGKEGKLLTEFRREPSQCRFCQDEIEDIIFADLELNGELFRVAAHAVDIEEGS